MSALMGAIFILAMFEACGGYVADKVSDLWKRVRS